MVGIVEEEDEFEEEESWEDNEVIDIWMFFWLVLRLELGRGVSSGLCRLMIDGGFRFVRSFCFFLGILFFFEGLLGCGDSVRFF